jgi:putative ABC transport system permease protein
MTVLRRFWFFLTRWRRLEDLDEEMQLHVEMLAAVNQRRGLPPDAAAREARRRFGNQLKLREESRDMWGFSELERMAKDLRYAVRQLIRRPVWTTVVVLTLALGIAANTSIFTLIDAMLFKPAPWSQDDRLVWIASLNPRSGRVGNVSYADYLGYRDRSTTLSAVLASGGSALSVGSGRPQRVLGGLVSGNYFDVLGIRAALGRTFTLDEDAAPGAHPVAVLSDSLWREEFGADPTVLNRTVSINGNPFTIIGIAPRDFTGLAYADDAEQLWVPLAMRDVAMPASSRRAPANNIRWLRVAGQLRNGATVAQADAEVRVLAHQLNPADTPPQRQLSARVFPVRGGMTPWEQHDLGPIFGLLAIVPALVLLVACANVANVLMARHVSRRKEFAMRRAMGASRGRLIRLLLTESLLLALLSAVAGFGLAFGLTALITRVGNVPADFSALVTPDTRSLFAAVSIAMLTTIVFGVAPAAAATKFDVLPALKDEGLTTTAASGGMRLRRVFIVAQVAVSLALLITAGLFFQSLTKAMRVDPGFEPRGAVTVSFDPDLQGYTPSRRDALIADLVERASSLPGAVSAALASSLPLSGETNGADVISESTTSPVSVMVASVSPKYFETMRLPLVRGRDFSAADKGDTPRVVIVSEALARRLWPGGDPIGQRLREADPSQPWREVVGVVRDAKYTRLTEEARGAYYAPLWQRAASPLSLVVRTSGDSPAVLSMLTDIAHSLDRNLPLFHAQTLEDSIHRTVNLQRAAASLLGVFGALALILASIGVYGVVAHSVSMRTREVGIRMSLGARAADVFRLFVRESLSLAFIGVALGLGISAATSRLLTSFLFGLTATDGITFIGGSIVLCLVTVVATFLPAHRAAHVDPLVALRHD